MLQVVILAGGTGTRIREASELLPKALVPIGPYPMILHIMKIYAHYGYTNFILALGYKQEVIKQYFTHFNVVNNDLTIELGRPIKEYVLHGCSSKGWMVTLADTGLETLKGGRLKRVEKYIKGDDFLLTYADAVADIDLDALVKFHQQQNAVVTVTGIHPQSKFGEIQHEGGAVTSYAEKPLRDGCLTSGGFMICNRRIFDFLDLDCDLECGPLEVIAKAGGMAVYEHDGYWKNCDTPKELGELQAEWNSGKARWKVWE